MARPKKNESVTLVEIVNDYYSNEARGDTRKLKYSNLAKYAEKIGIHAAWYDFQRDQAVLRRIAELKADKHHDSKANAIPAYKSLDIEALLKHCGTFDTLKQKLFELDRYWKKIYDEAVKTASENSSFAEKVQRLEIENIDLSQKQEEASRNVKILERENAYLRKIIRDSLYPSVANELLRQSNLPVPENEKVQPDVFSHMIESYVPQPIDVVQESQPKMLTRQEKLMEDMKRQVKKNGR